MDNDAEPPERAAAFHAYDEVIRYRNPLRCNAEDELTGLHHKRIIIFHDDRAHVVLERVHVPRIEYGEFAVFVDFKDIMEVQIHGRGMDVGFAREPFDFYASGCNHRFDVSVRKDHREAKHSGSFPLSQAKETLRGINAGSFFRGEAKKRTISAHGHYVPKRGDGAGRN